MPWRVHFTAKSQVRAIATPLLAAYPTASRISGGDPASPTTEAMLRIRP
jgi:hypothetical protein